MSPLYQILHWPSMEGESAGSRRNRLLLLGQGVPAVRETGSLNGPMAFVQPEYAKCNCPIRFPIISTI